MILWLRNTHGIIGYDCGAPAANLTTLSLLNIEECDIPQTPVNVSKEFVQLLQINDFQTVEVIQCKVEIDRTIKRCGMFSHTMDVLNGKYAYIYEVSREACIRMHTLRSFEISGTYITGLNSNQTTSRPVTLAGSVDATGGCAGSAYSDPYGTWTEVIVLATIRITLQDYTANVKIDSNRVQLRSGITCKLSTTSCTDIEGGNTFWDPLPRDSCKFSSYSLLYEGFSEKIIDSDNEVGETVYTLSSQDTIFALTAKGKQIICGHTLKNRIRTEHPKLIIFETNPGVALFEKPTQVTNLDIFAYMNSKFVYVERHIRSQLNQLYRNLLNQQCNLEQRMLQNTLAIATQSPDIFAYHLMKGPGYMALLAGEVIHIVKCVPVEVKLRQTSECYNQLPVMRDNQTYFLTPQTHILLKQGTQTTCNPLAPTMYLLENSWYKMIPRPVDTLPPITMKPLTKPTWKYISPGSLATSGIYTENDLENLREHIMFPAERPAVLNTLARGVMGHATTLQDGSLSNLIDTASVEKIAISAWQKFWNKFLIFGNFSAGCIAVYLLIRIAKLILDTLVHGYALHTVYGWSVYLLGAIWDSLTQLLLHLGRKEPHPNNETNDSAPTQPLDDRATKPFAPQTLAEHNLSTNNSHTCPLLPPAQPSPSFNFGLENTNV